ncbi:uncharacterized protein LOC105225693 [Bactrocera dorsalis]|uniref:Uncharacterized protein LOC105225693 n=1 Tax=Bactrocera dorsalis TaxID=27457 RepID=A0ABM3J1K3_BACDO|nr:uncharacterized protein LOC105225693 [Bactrocera dorsalis]
MKFSNAITLRWICSSLLGLITVAAWPEIPSKGKHTRVQDAQKIDENDPTAPGFPEPINNVTVSVGRDALLACVVDNLKGYKVAWVRVDTQTILSIHHNVISQNNRISLSYNDHRSWYLHIKEVEESDRGWYMCQVNTDPMRSQKGYLQVVVPPVIIESMTSNDMVVREGLNVTLMCKARGYPEPYVMWRREDGEEMLIGGEHVNVVDGELLHITKVSRLHMAAYLCVASNGVPPSISKRVHLRVQFPPMLSIPNQLEGAYVGQDVILECHTEAYPASINYWTTERGDMIISDTSRAGDKYETTSTVSGYTKYMKLKIRSVGPNDFGTYRCVAKNSLGETDGNIKLDEMPTPTTAIISENSAWNRSLVGKHRHRNKFDLNALPDYGVEEWRDGVGNGVAGNSLGDNNQTPVRNPPGAFHNSANSLAQHNLLGGIILWIKMQSFGIYKRLSSWCQSKRQRQHQQRQPNAAKPQQRQTQPQQLAAKQQKNGKQRAQQHTQQQEQHQMKWLPLKYQPKNHFSSSLQRCVTAYEQSAERHHKGGETAAVTGRTCGVAAYTQRGCLQQSSQWLIRRIDASCAAFEDSEVKMEYENGKSNELPNKVSVALEPLHSHMPMILRPLALTAPFLHAISSGVSAETTKTTTTATQMLTNLLFVKTMAANSAENFTLHTQKLAENIDAAERLSGARSKDAAEGSVIGDCHSSVSGRVSCSKGVSEMLHASRRDPQICDNNNNNTQNANGNSYAGVSTTCMTENERGNKDTKQATNVCNNNKRSNKTVYKVCANSSRYSAFDSKTNENFLVSLTKLSFALVFVAVALLLTHADIGTVLERYLPLVLLATYASQVKIHKQLQQQYARVLNSHRKTVCNNASSNNNYKSHNSISD